MVFAEVTFTLWQRQLQAGESAVLPIRAERVQKI
jgi:hypothetical protein